MMVVYRWDNCGLLIKKIYKSIIGYIRIIGFMIQLD